MQRMFFEPQAFTDVTGKRVETVRRVRLPLRIIGNVSEGNTSGIVAPGAIISLAPVFTLRAFVTVCIFHLS